MLTFHNLRAAVALLLLAINSIELAKALLPLPQHINADGDGGVGGGGGAGNNGVVNGNGSQSNLPQPTSATSVENETNEMSETIVIVIGTSILANAITAIIFTITLMWYHRVVEIKKSLGE